MVTNITRQRMLKLKNQISLLKLIRTKKQISQAELSNLTNLRPSTVSYLVRDLKDKGLVLVTGKGESGELGGKKSNLLSFDKTHGLFSGISIKKESIIFALSDFSGDVIKQNEISTSGLDSNAINELIINEINSYSGEKHYKGAGIAISSVVNEKGDIIYSSGTSLKVSHFHDTIQSKVSINNLLVENDANCAAYYAHLFLKEKYKNILTYLIYFHPFAIGSGIIIDNLLFRGASGGAGEILGSFWAPHEEFDKLTPASFTDKDKAKEINNFLAALENYILSTALFIDTEAIVLTGDFTNIEESILNEFIDTLEKTYKRFEIHIINSQDLAVRGAAVLSIDAYISSLLRGTDAQR